MGLEEAARDCQEGPWMKYLAWKQTWSDHQGRQSWKERPRAAALSRVRLPSSLGPQDWDPP